jgi:hypothetical protein
MANWKADLPDGDDGWKEDQETEDVDIPLSSETVERHQEDW